MSAISKLFLSAGPDLESSEMASAIDSAAWPHFSVAAWVHDCFA